MNRVYKFRAWHKEKKRMYRVVSLGTSDNGECATLALWVGFAETDLVGDNYPRVFELMQYIGINDKNGKEIFEGDIVKRNDGNKKQQKEKHVVKFTVNDGYNSYFEPMFMDFKKSEVIGNIYENPDRMPNNGGTYE